MQGERVDKLEALLTRIRSRTRAPHPKWAILAKDVHRLPAPAPVPVSDIAPTNPRVVAAKPVPAMDEVTTEPMPEKKPVEGAIVAVKLTNTAVQTPRPIEIVPVPTPAKAIPRAKTLLMGAGPVAKSPSSFPPPVAKSPSSFPPPVAIPPMPAPPVAPAIDAASLHEAPTARRRVDPRLADATAEAAPEPEPPPWSATPPPAEEAPIAQHRIVRVASPESPTPEPVSSPEFAQAPAPAPAPAPSLDDGLPQLPPAIPIPKAAPAPFSFATETPQKPTPKGWWLAIVVFVVFAALLLLAHHYNLLSPRT